MEEWKDIPGYEGIYQASTHGNIRSCEGKTTHSRRHGTRHWKQRIMKQKYTKSPKGRVDARIHLWKDGKAKTFLVARLVAITFLGAPPDGYTVNHIDGDRLNNRSENLEWLSLADNIRHGFRTGLYANAQRRVALSRDEEMVEFTSMCDASRFLGRSKGYVCVCLSTGRDAISVDGSVYKITKIAS